MYKMSVILFNPMCDRNLFLPNTTQTSLLDCHESMPRPVF